MLYRARVNEYYYEIRGIRVIMPVKFKYSVSDENCFSVFVNSEELDNTYVYVCSDNTQSIRLRIVQKNLLNCSGIKFITIIKILSSFFLYGENDYYAPYHMVSECLINPERTPLVFIEQKDRKIIIKNENDEEIKSSNNYEITKSRMAKYAIICILRSLWVTFSVVFCWRYLYNSIYLKNSIMQYFLSLILILFTMYSLYDMISVLIRSIFYLKKQRTVSAKSRYGFISCEKNNDIEKGR